MTTSDIITNPKIHFCIMVSITLLYHFISYPSLYLSCYFRNQTAGLLYLIAALDDPVDDSAFTIPNNTVIVSGMYS
jgi:hypothetical protein